MMYDEKYGDPEGGISPGVPFEDLPGAYKMPMFVIVPRDILLWFRKNPILMQTKTYGPGLSY